MAFCQWCGTPVSSEASFCPSCGRDLREDAVVDMRPSLYAEQVRAADGPGKAAVVGLRIIAITAVLASFALWMQSNVLAEIEAGDVVQARAETADSRVTAVLLLYTLAVIGTAIPWLIWQYRAHRALHDARVPNVRTSPGFGVGGWFIPFVNLVMPYRAVGEIWRTSKHGWAEGEPPQPWIVAAWWTLYLLGTIARSFGAFSQIQHAPGTPPVADLRRDAVAATVGMLLLAVSAVLAIRIQRDVAEAQRALAGLSEQGVTGR